MSAGLRLDLCPSLVRFVAATLIGSVVGTVVLLSAVTLFSLQDWAAFAQEMPPWTAVAYVYLAVLAGGVVPTLLIGAALMTLKRANAVTLVLTPAILFAMVLALAGRAMGGLVLPLAVAMPCGAAIMLLLLARQQPRLDVAGVFA